MFSCWGWDSHTHKMEKMGIKGLMETGRRASGESTAGTALLWSSFVCDGWPCVPLRPMIFVTTRVKETPCRRRLDGWMDTCPPKQATKHIRKRKINHSHIRLDVCTYTHTPLAHHQPASEQTGQGGRGWYRRTSCCLESPTKEIQALSCRTACLITR